MNFVMTIPQRLLQEKEISATGKLLWMLCMRMQVDTGDFVKLSAEDIALQMGLERLTVLRQAKELGSLGWMNLIEGRGPTNRLQWYYQAIMKKEVE